MPNRRQFTAKTPDGGHEAEVVAQAGLLRYSATLYVDGDLECTSRGFLRTRSVVAWLRHSEEPACATSVHFSTEKFVADVGFFPRMVHCYLRPRPQRSDGHGTPQAS